MATGRASRVAILVTGMHRSGTSALTRVLSIVGCELPQTLVQPKSGNVLGFWESQVLTNLNEEILACTDSFWEDWRPFDRSWYSSRSAEGIRSRGQQLIRDEFGESRLFVLKDPRLCRLLEFWFQAFDALGIDVRVVSPIRNPFDVAASLHARNHIDPFCGLLIWLRHVLDAEAASRGRPRAYLRYEQLMANARAVVEGIGEDLGLSWPNASDPSAEKEIDTFITPSMHHFHSEEGSRLSDPDVSHWIKDSFQVFDRWSRGEVLRDDTHRLDRIREAFDEATPAFSSALATGQKALTKSRLLARELEKSSRKLAACRGVVERRDERLENQEERIRSRDRRIENQEERIRSRDRRIENQEERIRSRDRRIENQEERIRSRDRRIENQEERIRSRDRRIENRGKRIRTLSRELEASRDRSTMRQKRILALTQKLNASRDRLSLRQHRIQVLSKGLSDSRKTVALRDESIQSLEKQLEIVRTGHVMSLAHRNLHFGIEKLQVNVLLNSEWLAELQHRPNRTAIVELRCNGRAVARSTVWERPRYLLRITTKRSIFALGDTLYSIHDVSTGEALAGLVTPSLRRATRIVGAVENWSEQDIRGWARDPEDAERSRRIAIHVNGFLRTVVNTDAEPSAPVHHEEGLSNQEFLWRVPANVGLEAGIRIDLFDAETGLSLRGSPIHLGGHASDSD